MRSAQADSVDVAKCWLGKRVLAVGTQMCGEH